MIIVTIVTKQEKLQFNEVGMCFLLRKDSNCSCAFCNH